MPKPNICGTKNLLPKVQFLNSVMDSKRLSLETSRQQVKEAEANLSRINSTAKQQLKEGRSKS